MKSSLFKYRQELKERGIINIRRDWRKYHNRQNYMDCQLVTALNALYYLTGKHIKQDSEEYESLVDLVKARHGSAISIKKAHKKFGLKVIGEFRSLFDFEYEFQLNPKHEEDPSKYPMFKGGRKRTKIPLPMEFNVWHKQTGFHSTCIVDHELKTGCFRIANFKWATSLNGWVFKEDLYQWERAASNCEYRLFGLTGMSRFPKEEYAKTRYELQAENEKLRKQIEELKKVAK